jgi:hypothetical protein
VFKKMIVLMLALSIFTVQAHATTQQGLKAAFDELNYSLTVDWDQKDEAFKNDQMKKFTAVLRDLQAKGLTNAQLVEFVKSEVKDAKVAKDVETAFNMISINKMSPAEANNYMMETMKKSYSVGASWSGEATGIILAAALVVVIVAVVLASNGSSNGGSVTVGGGSSCGYYDDYYCDTYCDFYGCWDDCYYVSNYYCY